MTSSQRLHAFLWSLVVVKDARRKVIIRWRLDVAGVIALFILFCLTSSFSFSIAWPITWQDIATQDATAQSFLIYSLESVLAGSGVAILGYLSWLSSVAWARREYQRQGIAVSPRPEFGAILRHAIQERDLRIVAIEPSVQTIQVTQPAPGAEQHTPERTITVAAPDWLVNSVAFPILAAIGSALALLIAWLFLLLYLWPVLHPDQYTIGGASTFSFDTSGPDSMLTLSSLFAILAFWGFGWAWRLCVRWRADARGAQVALSGAGLTIRDQMTRWRPRFIAWHDIVSLAQFIVYDDYLLRNHPHTIYLLDAGEQTFLWELPADLPYASPNLRARLAQQRAQAMFLLTEVMKATGQPLLDVSAITDALATMTQDPDKATANTTYPNGKPTPRDKELIAYLNSLSLPSR